MKSKSLQIAQKIAYFLSAYGPADLLEGFGIWNEGIEDGLTKQGWYSVDTKPTDREFFDLTKLDGKYWVQDKQKSTELKPVSPFMQRVAQFLSAKLGPKVIDSVYEQRLKSCGYNELIKCEYIKEKDGQFFCGACGCGFRKEAELSSKLRMARVECPKLEGGFKKINEVTEKHLLS